MNFGIIILFVVIGLMVYFIGIYNRLVSLRVGVDAAWADIDVGLKRRYDLIPALVDVVKGYKEYESSTLKEIVQARQLALNAKNVKEKERAESVLNGALGDFFALAEAYPDLKANANFLKLQNELSTIEDSIQNARRYYNAIVRDFNAKLESFPDLLVAQKFHFKPRDFFELDENESRMAQKMPKIDL